MSKEDIKHKMFLEILSELNKRYKDASFCISASADNHSMRCYISIYTDMLEDMSILDMLNDFEREKCINTISMYITIVNTIQEIVLKIMKNHGYTGEVKVYDLNKNGKSDKSKKSN